MYPQGIKLKFRKPKKPGMAKIMPINRTLTMSRLLLRNWFFLLMIESTAVDTMKISGNKRKRIKND
jgi:hypothetical protein